MQKNIKKVLIIALVIVVLAFSTFSSRIKLEFHSRHKVKHSKPKTSKLKRINVDELNKQMVRNKLYTRHLVMEKIKSEATKMKLKEKRIRERARQVAENKRRQKEEVNNKPYMTMDAQLTAYTKSGGVGSGNITASGEPVRANHTIAAPKSIPLHSIIEIPGMGRFEVTDRGSAVNGNVFDIYMDSEQECINFGRQFKQIKIYKN